MKTLVACFAVAAAVIVAALAWRDGESVGPENRTAKVAAAKATSGGGGIVAIPARGEAGATVTRAAAARPAPAPHKMSAEMRQLREGRSFKELYERLSAAATLTPEQQYILADIKARCSAQAKRQQAKVAATNALDPAQAKAQFAAAISEKDPSRQQRLDAYDVTVTNPCADIGISGTDNGRPMLEAAAAAGDPNARAKLLQEQIFASRTGCKPAPCAWNFSEAQLGTARQLFAGDDPFAMQSALNMMLLPFENFSLRAGPSELPVDNAAFHAASQMLACEMGVDCGANHPMLAQMCAMQGKCGFQDIRDVTMSNIPAGSVPLVNEYLEGLRRARTGDWSYFTVVQGPSAPVAAARGR